ASTNRRIADVLKIRSLSIYSSSLSFPEVALAKKWKIPSRLGVINKGGGFEVNPPAFRAFHEAPAGR
ncbi:MAG TPA: hypothetical protein PK600_10380, partial [Deltaproteobacteria bacterium]|nr:hypothetical protein [Deltaproteobacteria bacterium]